MARTWVTPAEGTGRHLSRASREGGAADPRGVLLSVDQLVVAAGDSVRRLRHLQLVSQGLDDEWAGERSLDEMVAQLDDVRRRLMRLRDQARQSQVEPTGEPQTPPPDRAG
jgi:hypothetical protein